MAETLAVLYQCGAEAWFPHMLAAKGLDAATCLEQPHKHGLPCSLCTPCRKRFEPFGNLKNVVLGARDARPADHKVNTSEVNTADPDYSEPVLGELCLTYVVFDIMFLEPDGVSCSQILCCVLFQRAIQARADV